MCLKKPEGSIKLSFLTKERLKTSQVSSTAWKESGMTGLPSALISLLSILLHLRGKDIELLGTVQQLATRPKRPVLAACGLEVAEQRSE